MLKNILLFLIPIIVISSCSEQNKILKSSDYNLKYEYAIRYYDSAEYYKAYPLIDELLGVFNGTTRAEKLYFYLAYCDYHLEDYTLAATRFNIFYKRYPTSTFAEEALFMSAFCNYKNSPNYSLDQSDTEKAIEEMQLFINAFPNSQRKDSCNTLVDILRYKLETKAYKSAYLYFHTENYKASIVAFNSLLEEFPDTDYKEKALFYSLNAKFLLAENSIISKKYERYEEVINSYIKFVDSFPKSGFIKPAEEFYQSSLNYKNKKSSNGS